MRQLVIYSRIEYQKVLVCNILLNGPPGGSYRQALWLFLES